MTALTAAPHVGDGSRPVYIPDFLDLSRYFIQRLSPGDALKAGPNAFQRVFQPIRIILKESDVRSFSANKTPRTRIFPIRPDFEDLAALGNDFQTTVLSTKDTGGFLPFAHIYSSSFMIRLWSPWLPADL
jgi:hypothetical protein